ncbi:MAG: hypothetical protein JSR80_03505 [Verrucomicrobia bacterium]|nr:hypothetical protein [Verrucomicrobiota bacterium]
MIELFDELAEGQRQKLFEIGRKRRPNLTEEDLLQPNDYPELENDPLFRYEEGVLEGILTVRAAWLAAFKSAEN